MAKHTNTRDSAPHDLEALERRRQQVASDLQCAREREAELLGERNMFGANVSEDLERVGREIDAHTRDLRWIADAVIAARTAAFDAAATNREQASTIVRALYAELQEQHASLALQSPGTLSLLESGVRLAALQADLCAAWPNDRRLAHDRMTTGRQVGAVRSALQIPPGGLTYTDDRPWRQMLDVAVPDWRVPTVEVFDADGNRTWMRETDFRRPDLDETPAFAAD